MKIALAADHAGFEELKQLDALLTKEGHKCHNFGPTAFHSEDDYPDFIRLAALAVASGEFERGIVLGGSGQGEAMAANRVRGVRCAVFYGTAVARRPIDAAGHSSRDPYEIIKLSREHNDSNVLSLSARFLTMAEMQQAINIWLKTPFSHEPKHLRRIGKLDET